MSYTVAGLRGFGDDTYTGAALRGFGDDTYTSAALRGMGCGCSNDYYTDSRGYGNDTYTSAALRGFGSDNDDDEMIPTKKPKKKKTTAKRLQKGSPEAKARMAYLRSLRGKGIHKGHARGHLPSREYLKRHGLDKLSPKELWLYLQKKGEERRLNTPKIPEDLVGNGLLSPFKWMGKAAYKGIKYLINKKKQDKKKGGSKIAEMREMLRKIPEYYTPPYYKPVIYKKPRQDPRTDPDILAEFKRRFKLNGKGWDQEVTEAVTGLNY